MFGGFVWLQWFCTVSEQMHNLSQRTMWLPEKKGSSAAFDRQNKTLKVSSCSAVVVQCKIVCNCVLAFCRCCVLPM